jgi:hypothetical protein
VRGARHVPVGRGSSIRADAVVTYW